MNPHDTPTVTVIMPVYNAAKYLPDALDSLLAQTFRDFEIVAVNDGSTDDSARVLAEYAARDARIRVVHRENGGCGAARNTGIALAKGRYIAQQDADDLSVPTRLERQAAFLDTHPDVCAAYCWTVLADESLKPELTICAPVKHAEILKILHYRNALQPNFMIRKSALNEVGGLREAFRYAQDYDMNLRVAEAGKVFCLPHALYVYRSHPNQTSVTRHSEQVKFGALACTFLFERKLRGRDSYHEFSGAGDIDKFLVNYDLSPLFFFFAGRRFLRNFKITEARKHLRQAMQGDMKKNSARLLFAKSYLPYPILKTLESFKSRFLRKQWTKRLSPEIQALLSKTAEAESSAGMLSRETPF
ncbi:MAG: hypothetical protein DRP79_01960 [Planctomycetota bacterium]|nr:MAG: hypothetical protein DRP79_01960 [Planctomycetota bacterium]